MTYHANVPKTIWKTDFEEGGVATLVQLCKTDDICKHNTEWRLKAEKKHQDSGSPPPPGEDKSGLNPPVLLTSKKYDRRNY